CAGTQCVDRTGRSCSSLRSCGAPGGINPYPRAVDVVFALPDWHPALEFLNDHAGCALCRSATRVCSCNGNTDVTHAQFTETVHHRHLHTFDGAFDFVHDALQCCQRHWPVGFVVDARDGTTFVRIAHDAQKQRNSTM